MSSEFNFRRWLLLVGAMAMGMLTSQPEAEAAHCSYQGGGSWYCACGSVDKDPAGGDYLPPEYHCGDCADLQNWCPVGTYQCIDEIGECGCSGGGCQVTSSTPPNPPCNYMVC